MGKESRLDMMSMEPEIIYEDAHIIVCRKPAGVAVQTKKTGEKDMESILKNYLKSPELFVIHRLDQPVEGLLLFARTKAAAAAAGRQEHMEKRYCAVVLLDKPEGIADGREHVFVDYLLKDGKNNTSAVTDCKSNGAKRAELVCRVLKSMPAGGEMNLALMEIELKTGRHHQIRVQMAHAGMPLLGDLKYGNEKSLQAGREMEVKNVALCAYRLSFIHPVTKKKMEFSVIPRGKAFQPFLPVNP